MNKPGVLVVLSGGQDSTTCLAWATKYFKEVHAISFDYGQRHVRELECAAAVAKLAGVASYEVIRVGPVVLRGTSPLLAGMPAAEPLEEYRNYEEMEQIIGNRIEKTFVPMRNALFLTIAANRAVCLGLRHVVTGICQADNANYPDCRETFALAQEEAIKQALGIEEFQVLAPLLHQTKAESIEMMVGMGRMSWLAFTHTAYDGKYPPTGKDHASVLRAHGFEAAGWPDPLVLRAALVDQVMALPETLNYSLPRWRDIDGEALMSAIRADLHKLKDGLLHPPSPDDFLEAVRRKDA